MHLPEEPRAESFPGTGTRNYTNLKGTLKCREIGFYLHKIERYASFHKITCPFDLSASWVKRDSCELQTTARVIDFSYCLGGRLLLVSTSLSRRQNT